MARYARLMDIDGIDDVVDLLFAAPQRLDDLSASRVGKDFKRARMHRQSYTYQCI